MVEQGAVSATLSLPMRGEWIEIGPTLRTRPDRPGLSPCGESGLKLHPQLDDDHALGVSPHAGRVD